MTKDIEQAARAVVEAYNSGELTCSDIVELEVALDPEPTREECIKWIKVLKCSNKYSRTMRETIVRHLQEPQEGVWIDNLGGSAPECRQVLVKYCDGWGYDYEVDSPLELDWDLSRDNRIIEYMIIE